MHGIPSLIQDLALILITAGIVTLVFKKLRQPLVLGYIMAGFLVSPNFKFTMSVVDNANIKVWADIGVMFLLFALGLDFSFKKILKMGIAPVIAALTIIFSMMTIGVLIGEAFGWSSMNGLFLAGMLAMSSTTIIYKAFDDLGLRQQQFSSLVMSVLILEDVLAIVMMVVLTTIAKGGAGDGEQMLSSLLSIVFFLVLWFIVGLFFIPIFLRKVRSLINDEVLLIVALALCCGMAVCASLVGFSSAFGSFVMGSILAETIEAKKIEKLVEPVKNLFGAIFFVSVGMLVDIQVVAAQWFPILVVTLAILFGQSIFGTFGFMLSGQTLKTAMRCSFSMAQIGEFAFIIATLGLSLGVVEDFLYPVVVTVSVITTFLTPYMIRGAVPIYNGIESHLPKVWISRINKISDIAPSNVDRSGNNWKPLLTQMAVNTLIYSVLTIAVMSIMLTIGEDFMASIIPEGFANPLCALLTVLLAAPFLRAMVMKKNKSEEFKALWTGSRHNRAPLVFTIIARGVLAIMYIFYICNHLLDYSDSIIICIAIAAISGIVYSRSMKNSSIRMERLFIQNLRSKDMAARAAGKKRPLFEGRLLDRDIHIAEVEVPQDTLWAGKTLAELNLAQHFGVHVSSIQRGRQHIHIPSGGDMLFPGDKLHAIGTDDQLTKLNAALQQEQFSDEMELDQPEMRLRRFAIGNNSILLGKSLVTSGLRDKYNCMLVGMEEDQESLSAVTPTYKFEVGDILWIVGDDVDIRRLAEII
ncbi:MAG: cation:proton antiporter [Prevotella sp.]|nr:cation:proton antiporter [Prevotella sp.]